MEFIPTEIPEVILIRPKVFGDERGFFMETFRADLFKKHGIDFNFVQDNHSSSSAGILRGLHYQLKKPQGKLVRAAAGSLFDVAVDMRKSSPTFGRSVSRVLSAANKEMLWVPPGFAHGFYSLEDGTHCIYKCTDYYAPEDEYSLRWDDPALKINWPLKAGQAPALSAKDLAGRPLTETPPYP